MFPFINAHSKLAAKHAGTKVISVSISKSKATMDLNLSLDKPASQNELQKIKDLIAAEYGLADINLNATQPESSANSEIGDVQSAAVAQKSPARTKTAARTTKQTTNKKKSNVIMGRETKVKPMPINEIAVEHGKVTVRGDVCAVRGRHIEKSNSWLLDFDITDYKGTINVTKFMRDVTHPGKLSSTASKTVAAIKEGMTLTVSGTLFINNFNQELSLDPTNIYISEKKHRHDKAEQKRVELHLHTQMSAMDGLTDIGEVISRAVSWGHPAIAITDHGIVQAFPTAASVAEYKFKNKIKIIYGMEGYLRDDTQSETEHSNLSAGKSVNSIKDSNSTPTTDNTDATETATAEYREEFEDKSSKKKRKRTNHVILLAKDKVGLKNLYKLVTLSHIEHLEKAGKRQRPIILKSLLKKHREGLIIGSACEAGELFMAIVNRESDDTLHKIADFYDYLEIQPLSNNFFMLSGDTPLAKSESELKDFNKKVVEIGEALNKTVVATGDAHYIDPEEEIFRHVILTELGYKGATNPLPLHFRTTDEMLKEFKYLGEEKAYEVVVTNTRKIAELCTLESPLPEKKKLFTPKIEGSAEQLTKLVYERLDKLYGKNPLDYIKKRTKIELQDILDRRYDVIYMLAQKIVSVALQNGSVVGSRGSVGSSFVAYLAGITDVNALPAHYRCPKCKHTEFQDDAFSDASAVGNASERQHFNCGADMPDKLCTACGTTYDKDGFNIPFETFLGFGGEKIPDIDLNFSGEYQALAHQHTAELVGEEYVFRAGTIGKVADKTAYGYVKKYLEKTTKTVSKAEENRLMRGCGGVKNTTGQHPGGLVIIPQGMEITDFCPAQLPADDKEKGIITTHFDYKCLEDNLIKLDALGHDNPTMIKMLKDLTGIDPHSIKFDDPETMSIFSSPAILGLPDDDPIIGNTGAIGIPEFGTSLSRQMLADTKPKNFDTLIKLSGYSHGENVWIGNAKELIEQGKEISETIGCREDIMNLLVEKGMDNRKAFKISESVRKGKGIPKGMEDEMLDLDVPEWYIKSCQMIQYLFPKAHATAYVMEAFIIAWFKVHRPLAFYSAHFYRRCKKLRFDARCMIRGINTVKSRITDIENLPVKTAKEQYLMVTLESVYEFYLRGFEFTNIDLYESDPDRFIPVGENKLRPPFTSISGLGETAANSIAENRKGYRFISIDDISASCPGVNRSNIDVLKAIGVLEGLPKTSQLTLF